MASTNESPKVVFDKVYKKALKLGLKPEDFERLESVQYIRQEKGSKKSWIIAALITSIVLTCSVIVQDWPVTKYAALDFYFDKILGYGQDVVELERCIVPIPDTASNHLFRPVEDCSICRGMKEVERISNISPEEFEKKYAYSKVPVVISDGAKNWTAPKVFGFEYFRKLYQNEENALLDHRDKDDCQFFPYKTSFINLEEVFEMSKERALLKDGSKPWYIGWSNCHPKISAELRQHYDRPYFLPKLSESSKTDWIFMGSPGYGAHMHVDNVRLPSWQAQITGTKKWFLEPPRECYLSCPSRIEVTMHPGEIIVLDTNTWYHSTLVVGDDMSITIGSEFD